MPLSGNASRCPPLHEAAFRPEYLSPRLVDRLADLYPESAHVSAVGLGQANDFEVWEYAKARGYILVSKESDFNEIGLLRGFPPRAIWIRRGNCSTREIEAVLRRDNGLTEGLVQREDLGVLLLY
jgi:predicted nuclease of predicted toxin-antitoxin system